MEARAGGEPDILFAVEQRTHRIRRHQPRGLFGRFAQRLLGRGRENGRHRRSDRLAKGIGNGRLVQGPERRQIGIVACRDLAGVTHREAGHMPLGLGVPQRLVGLAEPGKHQVERLAVIIDNIVLRYPGIDPFRRMTDTRPQAASVVINPKTIIGQMPAGSRRDVDQATEQPSGRAATAVADAHALVLGTAGAALQIAQIHRAGMGVGETIHGQRLQALGLETGIEREQHEQRRQITREQMIPAMKIVDERA